MSKTKGASNVVPFPVKEGMKPAARKPARVQINLQLSAAPYRCMDLIYEPEGPIKDKELREQIRARLVGNLIYFIPIQFLAEALNVPVVALKSVLSEKELEIVNDADGELGKWWGKYRREVEPALFVTTFGLQKLMGAGLAGQAK